MVACNHEAGITLRSARSRSLTLVQRAGMAIWDEGSAAYERGDFTSVVSNCSLHLGEEDGRVLVMALADNFVNI